MCIGQMGCWQCRGGGMLNQQRSPGPSFHWAWWYSEIEFVLFPWRLGIRFVWISSCFGIKSLGSAYRRSAGCIKPCWVSFLLSPSLCSMSIYHRHANILLFSVNLCLSHGWSCHVTFEGAIFLVWRWRWGLWGCCVWALPANERRVTLYNKVYKNVGSYWGTNE